tara:strand:+ start:2611 stop:2829 length:219 start_codon:yes stop_codon:yes gene_type:complete
MPQGIWLKWAKTEENNKIVYSTLMAALASGKWIRFHMNDSDTECKGQYIHIVESVGHGAVFHYPERTTEIIK